MKDYNWIVGVIWILILLAVGSMLLDAPVAAETSLPASTPIPDQLALLIAGGLHV